MDPLSVTASVVGLLGAAKKIVAVLSKVKSGIADAPRSLDLLLSQIKELEISFLAVSRFIDGIDSAPRQRMSMIRVEELVATLTEAVLTLSELEALVTPLGVGSEIAVLERFQWAWKEDHIASIMLRLDRHKATISLMLTIAQCESNLEAERSQISLHSLFQQLLDSNRDVSERLRNLEGIFETESVLTKCFRNGITNNIANDGDTITPIGAKQSASDELHPPRPYSHPFEIDLNTSRVYKRTQPYKSDVSFTSSAVRTHAWSVFSDLSLSQISSISIIALPIYANDLYNNEWYTFTSFDPTGYAKRNSNIISASEIGSNIHGLQATSNKMTCAPPEDFQPVEAADQLRQPMRSYKILILGDEAAGMLEFMLKFCYMGPHKPYYLDGYYHRQIEYGHQSYMIKIIDNFDQQNYPSNPVAKGERPMAADGLILMYSVTSRLSFVKVREYYNRVFCVKEFSTSIQRPSRSSMKKASPFWENNYPLVIVGNHSDRGTEREVSTDEGNTLAQELGSELFFYETPTDLLDTKKPFHELLGQILLRKQWLATKSRISTRSVSAGNLDVLDGLVE